MQFQASACGTTDLNLKPVLDEFSCQFDNHDAKWERRFADLNFARVARNTVMDRCYTALEIAH
jgi:hypothetical protein